MTSSSETNFVNNSNNLFYVHTHTKPIIMRTVNKTLFTAQVINTFYMQIHIYLSSSSIFIHFHSCVPIPFILSPFTMHIKRIFRSILLQYLFFRLTSTMVSLYFGYIQCTSLSFVSVCLSVVCWCRVQYTFVARFRFWFFFDLIHNMGFNRKSYANACSLQA